ncbi:COX15/CtaA family protein [Cellulomonas sp. DKR-3]|uniref:COX15/CtaA family protein n=1 Tax=Cellulomonas fulva TaxID=2835530 RepID=A0ABS5U1N7_9CELL|nr:COX15/CtaA family protein [Cellulomonas fulva]
MDLVVRVWRALLAWLVDHRYAVLVANLVGQIGIVGTGGAVRLTGSGLGCSTWPQCEPGSFVPQFHAAVTYHPFVEFGNRLMTFVLGFVAIAVAYVVWRDRTRARSFRLLGWAPLGGVAAQALIGGVLVLLELPPILVSLHFLISMALVALSLVLVHRDREGDGPPVALLDGATRALTHVLAVLLVVVLVLGTLTTGAGPHSGDDEVGYRLAVDPLLMTKIHAAAVWAFAAVLLVVVWRTRAAAGRPDAARTHRAALVLVALTVLQGSIGYVQTATGLPVALVNLHLVGAALLTAGTTRVWLCGRRRDEAAPAVPTAPAAPATTPA